MTTACLNGPAVRAWRSARGFTLKQLAERTQTTPSHISAMELGDKQPSWQMVERLAQAFEITPAVIINSPAPVNADTWPFAKGRARAERAA